ncbi:MAG: sensor histidine kinase [Chloroflexi bacterium]|nr:sensor histidine kinase [Chloroflexota bacterium]
MHALADFFAQNIILIYFLYGLAFFSMGLAVLLESGKASEIRLARALLPLGVFGLMHGVHEWGEMFQKILAITSDYRPLPDQEALRLLWLVVSFAALVVFGMMLIVDSNDPIRSRKVWLVPVVLTIVWLGGVPLLRAVAPTTDDWLAAADVWARYTLGIPAGVLAAWGLVRQQRSFREQGLVRFGRDSLWAAVAFGWYGVFGQFFTRPSVMFPSTFLNTDLFLHLFGIPVQLFRAAMATVAAVFVIRSLRAFEVERARRLGELQEAQLRESERREALRRDLLRQIVTAQEAERQRIARELHDETGQALTALGLGLRSIKSNLKTDPALAERHAAELEALAGRALDDLRHVVSDLRPSQLDDLGLVAALRWYAQEVEARTGMAVQLETRGPRPTLTPELNTVLFRIAQEALTNVVRHARATHAVLRLFFDESEVSLEVVDDGQGFEPEQVFAAGPGRKPWGLIGMQERATLVGGECRVMSAIGHGTEVMVVVPTGTSPNGKDKTTAG